MLLKKLAMCQKTYDYKDESKDVKAKVKNPKKLTLLLD